MEYFITDFKKCLVAIIIFLVLFVIDFIFGLCKGIFVEGISSSKLRMSVPKFIGYFGMILMCLMLDTLILSSTDVEFSPIGLISCVCFCLIEISSIIENAKQLGIDIPPIITNTISAIKNKFISSTDKEQKGGTKHLTFNEWVNKYLGKKTDYDGAYGVQCVDLIDCYIDQVLNIKKGFWGNAKEWWTNRNKSQWLKDNFQFITPDYNNPNLKVGDIGIRTSGTYGHIFVVKENAKNGKFKYYDQNATGNGDKMTLREKPYNFENITGILRPRNQKALGIEVVRYDKGSNYKLTAYINVWNKPTTKSTRKRVYQLTADGRKHATSSHKLDYAILKPDTVVTALDVKKDTEGNIWLKIPSGYIPVYYNGVKRAVWKK